MIAKTIAQLLMPMNLALELWLLAALLRWRGRRGASRAFAGAGLLIVIVASLPVVSWTLTVALESKYPALTADASPTADAIVVLGGAIGAALPPRAAADLSDGADRVLHAARLFRAGKAHVVVASGGTPFKALPPEAPAMAALLEEWGVAKGAILLEDSSETTWGNATETWRLLEGRGARRILLVTSAMHMPRAVATFERVGFEVTPSPTDFQAAGGGSMRVLDWLPNSGALDGTTWALREMLGRAYYAMRGWL